MTLVAKRISRGIYRVFDNSDTSFSFLKLRFVSMRPDTEPGREAALALLQLDDSVDTRRRDSLEYQFPPEIELTKLRDFFRYDNTREIFDGLFHPRLRAVNLPVYEALRDAYFPGVNPRSSRLWRVVRNRGLRRTRGGDRAYESWGLAWGRLEECRIVWPSEPGATEEAHRRGAERSVEHSREEGEYQFLSRQLRDLRRLAHNLARATRGYYEVTRQNAAELQALRGGQAILDYLVAHPVDGTPAGPIRNLQRLNRECIQAATPVLVEMPPQTPYRPMHNLTHWARQVLDFVDEDVFKRRVNHLVEQARPFESDADRPPQLVDILQRTTETLAFALRALLECPVTSLAERGLNEHIRPMLGALHREADAELPPRVRSAVLENWNHVEPAVRDAFLSGDSPGGAYLSDDHHSVLVSIAGIGHNCEKATKLVVSLTEKGLPLILQGLLFQRHIGRDVGRVGGVIFRAICRVGHVTTEGMYALALADTTAEIERQVGHVHWGHNLSHGPYPKALGVIFSGLAMIHAIHALETAEGHHQTHHAWVEIFGHGALFAASVLEMTEYFFARRAAATAAAHGAEAGVFAAEATSFAGRAAAAIPYGAYALTAVGMSINVALSAQAAMEARRQGDNLGMFYNGVAAGGAAISAAGAALCLVPHPAVKAFGKCVELIGLALNLAALGADWVTRALRNDTHEVFAKYINHFGRYVAPSTEEEGHGSGGHGSDEQETSGPYYHLKPYADRDRRVRAFVRAFERVNGAAETPGEEGVSTAFQDGHWGVDFWTPPVDERALAPLYSAYLSPADLHKIFDTGTEASWGRRIAAHFRRGEGGDIPDYQLG